MRIDEKSEHEKQFVQSEAGRQKKHYEAPILTLLRVDPARADLLARARVIVMPKSSWGLSRQTLALTVNGGC